MRKRTILSIISSSFLAVLVGVGLQYCLADVPIHHHDNMPLLRPLLFSAHFFSLFFGLFFYYMNYSGCLKRKRQSVLLIVCIYAAVLAPLCFLNNLFGSDSINLVRQYSFDILAQFLVIGFVNDHFLRIKGNTYG